jgi:hypothetical protein
MDRLESLVLIGEFLKTIPQGDNSGILINYIIHAIESGANIDDLNSIFREYTPRFNTKRDYN